jgi:hypothetical protein
MIQTFVAGMGQADTSSWHLEQMKITIRMDKTFFIMGGGGGAYKEIKQIQTLCVSSTRTSLY